MMNAEHRKELKTVSVRLPVDVVESMEALRERIQASPEYYGKVNVSTAVVVRMALLSGLDEIERKYPR